MKKSLVCLPVLMILLTASLFGQVSQNAVPFLLIAPGARAGGMGETFVAIANDATAVHWNPAGLGRYPLSPDWIEHTTSEGQEITKIALVKNDLPDINFKQYDIWAIINGHLAKYKEGEWITKIVQRLDKGRSIKSIILRYTGMDEEQVKPYYDKLVSLNSEFALERIDSLELALLPYIPDDYQYIEEITNGFERLKTAWGDLKIAQNDFTVFEDMVNNSLSDDQMSISELDSIAFGFDPIIKKRAIEKIEIPLDIVLNSPINCLESHGGMLYVGADDGFFRYDPKRRKWKRYGLDDNLPSLKITALAKYRRKSIVIGTDKGIVYYDGAKIKNYAPDTNAPSEPIAYISTAGNRNVWAATSKDLYYFNSKEWKNYHTREVTIGEDLDNIIESFYRAIAVIDKENLKNKITDFNGIKGDIAVGQKIKLPYKPVIRGRVLSMSSKDKILWIGTSRGVVMFNGESFFHFGYRQYTAEKETSVENIARELLPDPTPEKIQQLVKMIKQYNRLDSDTVAEGKSVMVYANALGSPILSIAVPSSKKAYIGTSFGVVEFNDGIWSRFPKLELAKIPAHTIKTESGEMWFATANKVFILSKAQKQITFMHSNYLVQLAVDDDLYFEFFSFVYPTSEWGTFGIGVTYLSMGEMLRTTETGEPAGNFYPYDMAVTVSYGTRLMKNLSAGLSARYINSHLSDFGAGAERGSGTGFSFAMDGGLLYDISPKTTFAATVTNIGPDISYIDTDQADPLPRKLAVAMAYKVVDSPYNKLTVIGEADKLLLDLNDDIKTEIKEIIPHIGMEYWYSNYVSLRAGYIYDEIGVQRYFTLGASMQWTNYRFDFSYVPESDADYNRMGDTMRFSMNVCF
ncbi:MAG: PorV/PorQ family protein [candidate division Zixibacteria bacterium]|nr:PorV/PorQ family protein [candidate division Zixibacteria bacterium]